MDAKHKSTVVAVAELGPGLAAAHTVRHDNDTRAQVGESILLAGCDITTINMLKWVNKFISRVRKPASTLHKSTHYS